VVSIGEESQRPSERPLLSKDDLRGDRPAATLYVHDECFHADGDIELMTGTHVESLDPPPTRSPCPGAFVCATSASRATPAGLTPNENR
jgi:NADPH-dependent 2,4-dienoyl-CoA reductase/sulfur reductase-like enzyme